MYYDTHVTTRAEREKLIELGNFSWMLVDPARISAFEPPAKLCDPRGRSVVWREGAEKPEELYFGWIKDVIEELRVGKRGFYTKLWGHTMTAQEAATREQRLLETYLSMIKDGFDATAGEFGGICVEQTGERIDGSYRMALAQLIKPGVPKLVKQYRWRWQDVDRDLLRRKLAVDAMSTGPDYYAINFLGEFINYNTSVPDNLFLNVAKYLDLEQLLRSNFKLGGLKVLDLGCNAGYHSIQLARKGASVLGLDRALTASANLYRLCFEHIEKRDLNVKFKEQDITQLTEQQLETRCDVCLCLCTHYHLPLLEQRTLIGNMARIAPVVILQGNLAKKESEYHNCDVTGMVRLLSYCGLKTTVHEYLDKPFAVGVK